MFVVYLEKNLFIYKNTTSSTVFNDSHLGIPLPKGGEDNEEAPPKVGTADGAGGVLVPLQNVDAPLPKVGGEDEALQ